MKWNTMKWLLDNKKDVIDKLLEERENIFGKLKSIKEKKSQKGITKTEFSSLLKDYAITRDLELINKLFWVFDEDGSGDLRYEELVFGLEMFRDSTIDEKLKAFFELCDFDGSGAISKGEFLNLLKKNLITAEEKNKAKKIVDEIFKSVELNTEGEITFDSLKLACHKNKGISDIIYNNLNALHSINHLIDNDIKNNIFNFQSDILRKDDLKSSMPLREAKFLNFMDSYLLNEEKKKSQKIQLKYFNDM
jgi:Ca2+-binding EF-hand superfamily protein